MNTAVTQKYLQARIAAEQVKNQPVMQFDCIGVMLSKQLQDINRRVQQLHQAACSEHSDQRALVEACHESH